MTAPHTHAGGRRHSHSHHSTVDDHLATVSALLAPMFDALGTETVRLTDALGRVTADPVVSPVDLPLFRNSQMDGFAVNAADIAEVPASLPVVGEIPAGPGTPSPLAAGTAVRIMTGAVVPDGATAVVPVEDTHTEGAGAAERVVVGRSRAAGEYVRERGSDVRAGVMLLPRGIRLASRHLAALAAAGLDTVEVTARARVAVITTGAELVSPGDIVHAGQVYDANSVALTSAVTASGGLLAAVQRVVDNPDEMASALRFAATSADLILTSGGISQGDYEVVREVLVPLGASTAHLAMQPGGPQLTGTFEGVPVVGFPGNPVSTQISFEVFVAPLLRERAGLPAARRELRALAAAVTSIAGKRQFLRGRTGDDGLVSPVSGPGSHLVAGLAAADVLLDIPAETTHLAEGDLVETVQL
jgi:molybdopterin molybdotransferase